jgi:hypothetical protein
MFDPYSFIHSFKGTASYPGAKNPLNKYIERAGKLFSKLSQPLH